MVRKYINDRPIRHDSTDKPTSALDTGKCSLAESVKRFMEKNSEVKHKYIISELLLALST